MLAQNSIPNLNNPFQHRTILFQTSLELPNIKCLEIVNVRKRNQKPYLPFSGGNKMELSVISRLYVLYDKHVANRFLEFLIGLSRNNPHHLVFPFLLEQNLQKEVSLEKLMRGMVYWNALFSFNKIRTLKVQC